MKRSTRKLALDTSTLRNLTPTELTKVAGGLSSAKVWCSTFGDTGCCDFQATDNCTGGCHW